MIFDFLRKDCVLDYFTSESFKIIDSGPLLGAITKFKIRRSEKQELILTTFSKRKYISYEDRFPDRKVDVCYSLNENDVVKFSDGKNNVYARDVLSNKPTFNSSEEIETMEESSVRSIDFEIMNAANVYKTIELIENIDENLIFSDKFQDAVDSSIKKVKSGFYINSGAYFEIGNYSAFIAPISHTEDSLQNFPAAIIYDGFIDEVIRKKIRECISFLFGRPLVYYGCSLISIENKLLGFSLIAPYILNEKLYGMIPSPPTLLGRSPNGIHCFVDSKILSKAVTALFEKYDQINFQKIGWIYWHAIFAPCSAKAVQFGAAIELLQKNQAKKYRTRLLDKDKEKYLRAKLLDVIRDMEISESEKRILENKISNLNSLPQKMINDNFYEWLSLKMSEREKSAWQSRNDAAHGNDNKGNSSYDNELLQNILHRIILKITGASNVYIDYASENTPTRILYESAE